jgi:peptidoglycan/xylan/chitin deacetylase (PgdA/CDA1 family)
MNRRQALRAAIVAGTGLTGLAACASTHPAAETRQPTGPSVHPSSGASAVALPPEITHGPRTRPAVALTFHGQGDPRMAGRLLTELSAGGARVTVMAVGAWLATQPAIARRILDDGHELGNHTEHHLAIAAMTGPEAYAEIDGCAQTLRRLTGSRGTWFRPSQTEHSTALIRREARRAGYPTCLSYDVDSLDYTDPPAGAVVHTTLSAVGNGSIVSMHFGHAATIAAIGPILDGLRTRGLRAVTMTELVTT